MVEQLDPATGEHAPLIGGLKTAIDVLPTTDDGETTDLLVLQHASGIMFAGPGSLTRFSISASDGEVLCRLQLCFAGQLRC